MPSVVILVAMQIDGIPCRIVRLLMTEARAAKRSDAVLMRCCQGLGASLFRHNPLLCPDVVLLQLSPSCCRTIAVLGVDFMSENVRAILDEAGHKDVQVS